MNLFSKSIRKNRICIDFKDSVLNAADGIFPGKRFFPVGHTDGSPVGSLLQARLAGASLAFTAFQHVDYIFQIVLLVTPLACDLPLVNGNRKIREQG